jgi:DNA-binding MarR family transcriptional regulator/N-acetylglutamate synthase-like GNAT family acetyltransferase
MTLSEPERSTESDHAVLRRFNRVWTQRVGALDESFLGTGRALAESRLLFEIGPNGAGVHELRVALGLDSGYLSRLLRSLEASGLVTVTPDRADGRRRTASLTARGRVARHDLDSRSEDLARALVGPLGPRGRAQLDEALATAELLIRAATVDLSTVDPGTAAAVSAVESYFAELDERFPGGFDPGDAARSEQPAYRPPSGAFVLATSDGETVACGGVQRLDEGLAEIKRMWVSGAWRGAGIGSRMLAHLEDQARRLGYARVRLDTNGTLTEAIALYAAAGYHPIERYNDNPYAERWFEKTLTSR